MLKMFMYDGHADIKIPPSDLNAVGQWKGTPSGTSSKLHLERPIVKKGELIYSRMK
jgi:hypothetical protein